MPRKATTKEPKEKSTTKEATAKEATAKETTPKETTPKKANAQPELNIGLIGHVDHGKTTLTEQLSGKWTDTHSEEMKRGITIRLGYANVNIFKWKSGTTTLYTTKDKCEEDPKAQLIEVRKISFVDAPGHESLMATMLSGATIMDGALLLVAANEECPQPQTAEHITALEMLDIGKIIVVQNKIDLVSKEQALNNHKQIKELLSHTKYKDAPIVPVSAQHGINISALLEVMDEVFPVPKRDDKLDPIMYIARSFDVNKPGSDITKIIGGVLGGSLQQGRLRLGDTIEIKPGYEVEEKNVKVYYPLTTKIVGLMTGNESLDEVGPGGSIAVLTELDPSVVKSDRLTGNMVGKPGTLPKTWRHMKLNVTLLERVVGSKEQLKVDPIKLTEPLMMNVNSASTVGVVTELGKNEITVNLKIPVCADVGARITISRVVANRFRLIGYGIIKG